jgi:hypothetical protein
MWHGRSLPGGVQLAPQCHLLAPWEAQKAIEHALFFEEYSPDDDQSQGPRWNNPQKQHQNNLKTTLKRPP